MSACRNCFYYFTKMYPNASVFLLSSAPQMTIFPHVVFLISPQHPRTDVPKPKHELQVNQSFSLFAVIPIRTFMYSNSASGRFILKPSLLQFCCKHESSMRDNHVFFPTVVLLKAPSAIKLNSELAWRLITIQFVTPLTLIPGHILSNGVFQ